MLVQYKMKKVNKQCLIDAKEIKCSASLAFNLFSPTHLINSIKHEHSYKIFYLSSALSSAGKQNGLRSDCLRIFNFILQFHQEGHVMTQNQPSLYSML